MASEDRKEPQIVTCAQCGKRIHITESVSFGEYDRKMELIYFCSPNCAMANLFGILRQFDEFMLGLENAR